MKKSSKNWMNNGNRNLIDKEKYIKKWLKTSISNEKIYKSKLIRKMIKVEEFRRKSKFKLLCLMNQKNKLLNK